MKYWISYLETAIRDAVQTERANPPLPGMDIPSNYSTLHSELEDAHVLMREYQAELNRRN